MTFFLKKKIVTKIKMQYQTLSQHKSQGNLIVKSPTMMFMKEIKITKVNLDEQLSLEAGRQTVSEISFIF